MPQRTIICAAESRSQASRIVGHLIDGGFAQDAVSVLLARKNASGNSTGKSHSETASTIAARAGVGALLGGAFIWLSGMGTLSVPGLGPLIIAGAPLVAAMGQFPRGGMPGVLGKMGLSKRNAGFYAARIRQGSVLISISVAGTMEATAAKKIIQAMGLQNILDTADEAVSPVGTGQKGIGTNALECSPGSC